jgi:hypothetical protein
MTSTTMPIPSETGGQTAADAQVPNDLHDEFPRDDACTATTPRQLAVISSKKRTRDTRIGTERKGRIAGGDVAP